MTETTKKRGLGRGLDALFGDVKREEESFTTPLPIKRADEMVTAAQTATKTTAEKQAPAVTPAPVNAAQRKLAVDKLTPGKFQPRRFFKDEALENLADSIAVHGVLQPLLVRPLNNNMYEIIAGERRWRAAQKAQLHELPVIIQQLTDKEALEIALIENLQREDLTAVEEAEGYQRLMDEFGHTQDVLAQHLGKSRSHIANTLRLLKLPAAVQTLIQNGNLSAGHARTLVGAQNPLELAQVIIKRNLSVRQAEKLAQKTDSVKLKKKGKNVFVQKDVDILALEEKMTTLLGLKVQIEGAGASGKIVIEYKTLDQLDDVLARLSSVARK